MVVEVDPSQDVRVAWRGLAHQLQCAYTCVPLMPTPADSCKFVEYDPRAHRLETLASFTVWVQSASPSELPAPQIAFPTDTTPPTF